MVGANFMKSIDLGTEISSINIKYPVFRGNHASFMSSNDGDLSLYPNNFISFSIHNMTHMDLPGCIENQITKINQNSAQTQVADIMKDYSRIIETNAYIVDISKKELFLSRFIDKDTGFISRELEGHSFIEIMNQLEIKRDDLEPLFNDIKNERELENSIILFKPTSRR